MTDYYDFAVGLARSAGEKLKTYHQESLVITHKGFDPKDILTNADIELGKYLVGEIKSAYPEHRIYSEEGDTSDSKVSEWEWTLDPIDGSANFSRGIPHFAVCVGLLHRGVPIAGAVFNPVTNELFSFEKGTGAFLNDIPINASLVSDIKKAYSLLRSGRKDEYIEWGGETLKEFLGSMNKVSNFGSSSLDLCFLAAKRVDVVVYGTLTTADISVAVGIVREAGGEVYSVSGDPIELSKKSQTVVATSTKELFAKVHPLLHIELLPR